MVIAVEMARYFFIAKVDFGNILNKMEKFLKVPKGISFSSCLFYELNLGTEFALSEKTLIKFLIFKTKMLISNGL